MKDDELAAAIQPDNSSGGIQKLCPNGDEGECPCRLHDIPCQGQSAGATRLQQPGQEETPCPTSDDGPHDDDPKVMMMPECPLACPYILHTS